MTEWILVFMRSWIGRSSRREQERAEVEHPDEPVVGIDDIDKEDLAHVLPAGPDSVDHLADGRGFADGHELHLHEPAGGVLGVGEEGLDLTSILPRQRLDDASSEVFRQIRDDIGGVVGGHLLEGVGELIGLEVFGEIIAEVVRELLHEIGDPGDLEPIEEMGPEIVREDAEQRREIGRVSALDHRIEGGGVTGLDEVFDL